MSVFSPILVSAQSNRRHVTVSCFLILALLLSWICVRYINIDTRYVLKVASRIRGTSVANLTCEQISRIKLHLELIHNVPLVLMAIVMALNVAAAGKVDVGAKLRRVVDSAYLPLITGISLIVVLLIGRHYISYDKFPFENFFVLMGYFYLVLVCVILPIGMNFFRRTEIACDFPERVALALVTGFLISSCIWAIFVSLGITVNSLLCLLFLLGCCVLAMIVNLRFTARQQDKVPSRASVGSGYYLLAVVLMSVFISWGLYLYAVGVPDGDITSQVQISSWLKAGQSYRLVHPFLDSSVLVLRYPPAFSGITALYSMVSRLPINIVCYWLWLLSYPLYSVILFVFCRSVTKSSFIASICVLLSFNNESLGGLAHNGGQVQEMFAQISGVTLIYLLIRTEHKTLRMLFLFAMLLGASILFQTGVAFPFVLALAVYPFIVWVINKKLLKKQFVRTYVILLICMFLILAWLGPLIPGIVTKHSEAGLDNFSGAFLKHFSLKPLVNCHYLVSLLSLVGSICLLCKKNKNEGDFLIMSWLFAGFACLFVAGDTLFFRAFGFMALRIILCGYALGAIVDIFKVRRPMLFRVHLVSSKLGKGLVPFVILCIWGFMFYPDLKFIRYGPFLGVTDYRALLWLKNHSEYENTLILNSQAFDSWYMKNYDNVPLLQLWAGAVAERRTVNFWVGRHHTSTYDMDVSDNDNVGFVSTRIKALNEAYNHLYRPESLAALRRYNISHIFVIDADEPYIKQEIDKVCEANDAFTKVFDNGAKIIKVTSVID